MLGKLKEPQAHHWIVLRLLRQVFKAHGRHTTNVGLSTLWLVREVGGSKVVEMIQQLEKEEG